MKYNRVFLVRPKVPLFGHYLPVGLGIISEVLSSHSIENEVMDMNLGHKPADLMRNIKEFMPDLIGLSVMSVQYSKSYDLMREIKRTFRDVPVVVGGPHMSLFREEVLRACEAADFGVVCEGEETIIELCKGKNPEDIKGLIYRSGERTVYTGDRKLIDNLDRYPFSKYGKFELSKYVKDMPIYSSRGCPYNCIFCSVHNVIGRGFRSKSAEYVLGEIRHWYDRGYRNITFFDDNFSQDMERIFRLCELITKDGMKDLKLVCADVRADKLSRKLLEAMWKVGFKEVDLGVEGGNDRLLKKIKKGVTIERIEQTIKDACELGYDVRLFFQVGFPGQTVSDIEDAVRLALKYPIKMAHFFNTVPTPHTELFNIVMEKGRLLVKPGEYMDAAFHTENQPLFETEELSFEDRRKMLEYTEKVSIRTLKKYYLRKFEKYGLLGKVFVELGVNRTAMKLRENRVVWNLIRSVQNTSFSLHA